MIKNVLSHIDGIGVYGVISISIFFGFFTGVLVWAGLKKKNYLNQMSALPLDSGERETQSKNNIQG
jgi:hypothetical protein